jgi:hypothetical protein
MKLRFICEVYRLELIRHPDKAIHCWQNGFDAGSSLYEQEMWDEALPYLGSAFETSEIILTTRAIQSTNARELFTASAALLIDVFGKTGAIPMTQKVYWLAVQRLTQELRIDPCAATAISQHLERLYRHCQRPGCEANALGALNNDPFTLTQDRAVMH